MEVSNSSIGERAHWLFWGLAYMIRSFAGSSELWSVGVVFDSSWSPFSGSTLELAAQPPRLGKGLELASFGAPNRGGQRATSTAHSSVMKREKKLYPDFLDEVIALC